MSGLSKRSWNNVLIYSVLVLIGLFFVLPEYLQRKSEQTPQSHLIAGEQTLLALHFPSHQIERAGPQWRVVPADLSADAIGELLHAWQHETLPAPSPLNPVNPILRSEVSVWLTGKPAQQAWQLYQVKEQYWLKAVDTELWYRLSDEFALQIFPKVIH